MAEQYSRQIIFEAVPNFRDLGGYKAHAGRRIAWRRLFRSAEFVNMTRNDFNRLTVEIGLASVIDLRSAVEIERHGMGLLSETGIKFHNISFLTDDLDRKADEQRYKDSSNMSEFYLFLVKNKQFGQRVVEALEVIAAPENHPLVFHCAIGKDRTGLLAAFLLSALGVADKDVIEDYALSGPPMQLIIKRLNSKPETAGFVTRIPAYFWDAVPESMALLLNALKQDYGSTEGYLKENGADASLVKRLENALLV
jgi:protein-tyrosine phosphatase